MSTAELDPISHACRLLREGAAELKNCHTLAATGHDWTGEPEAKAAYDESMAAADALERWADSIGAGGVEPLRGRQCLHQIAEPAVEYPALPEPDRVMEDWSIGGVLVDYFTTDQMRAYVDADRAMRAAQSENLHCKSTQKRLATQWGFVPAGAQQPGTAGLVGALEDAQRAINSMKVEAETAAQGDEQMMLEACETISNEGLQADMAIRAALASHGQAPASRKPKADSVDYVTEWAVTLWKGRERIRKELRASHGQAQAAPQTSPAAQGDALDAARYRYLRDGDWREHEELESVIRLQLNTLWDAKIDAARAAQDGGDVALFTTPAQRGELAGDGKPCNNDHDPDCRWPDCLCRTREEAAARAEQEGK